MYRRKQGQLPGHDPSGSVLMLTIHPSKISGTDIKVITAELCPSPTRMVSADMPTQEAGYLIQTKEFQRDTSKPVPSTNSP